MRNVAFELTLSHNQPDDTQRGDFMLLVDILASRPGRATKGDMTIVTRNRVCRKIAQELTGSCNLVCTNIGQVLMAVWSYMRGREWVGSVISASRKCERYRYI